MGVVVGVPGSPLVDVGEIAATLPDIVILDVRWRLLGPPARSDFEAGHIPGAQFVDLDRDLAAQPGPHGRHPLPTADDFEATMRRLGVSAGTLVVCYDDSDGSSAARAWWLLRYFGHDSVRVLDGGYAGWLAAGQPVSTADPPAQPGTFVARPGHLPLLDARDAEDMARVGVLLDVRAPERYRGEQEPVDPVAGHIPGAVNLPFTENVRDSGHFWRRPHLRSRFESAGVTDARPVGTYCGSGVNAAQAVLALEVAGFRAALYADSWSGWVTDPARPVAVGDSPG